MENLAEANLALGYFNKAKSYSHRARLCRLELGDEFKAYEFAKTEGYALLFMHESKRGQILTLRLQDVHGKIVG